MKTTFAFVLLAASALSAPALADRVCLQRSQIYNWNALNDRTIIVEDNLHKKYKLSLLVSCQHLQFHERLGFKTFDPSALACVSKGDSVISGTEIGPQTCPIKTIEAYTPEMEKADKDAAAAAKAAAH
ncbi:MAG TPA: DUF6491 family protein [Rhizomicrobium sp.]|nr:DUF6491 family protein [Rhizomicrobium sp.]